MKAHESVADPLTPHAADTDPPALSFVLSVIRDKQVIFRTMPRRELPAKYPLPVNPRCVTNTWQHRKGPAACATVLLIRPARYS